MKESEDLLGMLFAKYSKEVEDHSEEAGRALASVSGFVEWARKWLQGNPIIGTYPVSSGLGVRFQDYTGVPFVPQPPERGFRDDCIHVTNPGFNKATDATQSPEAMPITGRPK
jgi:hypothetical protein